MTLDLLWKPNGRIEELPPEILFHTFKQLFDLKSIINCYNTNLRWKKIVEDVLKNSTSKFSFHKVINNSLSKCFKIYHFYFVLAKIIIAGGQDGQGNVKNTVEIIDLINPKFKCTWIDERSARLASFGGILQNKPMLFGGSSVSSRDIFIILKDGIVLGSNEETYEYEIEGRTSASSVVLNQSRLWVTGGLYDRNKLNTSQFLSLDQPPEKGPDLPFTLVGHCMVQVDSETIYLMGGFQNHGVFYAPDENADVFLAM